MKKIKIKANNPLYIFIYVYNNWIVRNKNNHRKKLALYWFNSIGWIRVKNDKRQDTGSNHKNDSSLNIGRNCNNVFETLHHVRAIVLSWRLFKSNVCWHLVLMSPNIRVLFLCWKCCIGFHVKWNKVDLNCNWIIVYRYCLDTLMMNWKEVVVLFHIPVQRKKMSSTSLK